LISLGRVSFEQVLEHGGGEGGARLLALDGALQVLHAVAALPDLLKLPREDLGAALPGQARLLQAQLAHLHVVLTCRGAAARREEVGEEEEEEEEEGRGGSRRRRTSRGRRSNGSSRSRR